VRRHASSPLALLAVALLVAALLPAANAAALAVPDHGGRRVVDLAGILSDSAEGRISAELERLEKDTGAQVAVLTIPSLEGDPLDDFSLRVAEAWKLGRADTDNGVLLLVARDDRRVRIEVGYGLEPVIPDILAGRIIDGLITPRFRNGDFDAGVEAGVSALDGLARGDESVLPAESEPSGGSGGGGGFGFLLIFALFLLPHVGSALVTRGAAGWVLLFFLTPFVFALPAMAFGAGLGMAAAAVWLLVGSLLRLFLPERLRRSASRVFRSRGGRGGGFFGGGGGFSSGGGGFSGGGGSFGGGGASGSW
jgi:uncharacterized protein